MEEVNGYNVVEVVKAMQKRIECLEGLIIQTPAMPCKRINKEAKLPTRKHPTDAGIDVYALEATTIAPHSFEVVKTGVTFDFPNDTVAFAWPKSGNVHLVGAGVIDSNYQGEILVKVFNTSDSPMPIPKHAGIAQLVIVPVLCPPIQEVDEIHDVESDRGATGGIVFEIT